MDNFYDLNQASVFDIAPTSEYERPVYRSVAIDMGLAPPTLFKSSELVGKKAVAAPLGNFSKSFLDTPFHIIDTHFITNKCVDDCDSLISGFLRKCSNLSFDTDYFYHKWSAVVCEGSSSCKFEIHLYESEERDGIIVEVNRLKGTSAIFHRYYRDIKKLFDYPVVSNELFDNMDIFHSAECESDDTVNQALGQIDELVASIPNGLVELSKTSPEKTSSHYELINELCRIICILANREDMRVIICRKKLVPILYSGLTLPFPSLDAVVALYRLSLLRACHSFIVSCGVLPKLLELSVAGNLDWSGIRFGSASCLYEVLSNLPTNHNLNFLTDEKFCEWKMNVEHLKDSKLQSYLNRVAKILSSK